MPLLNRVADIAPKRLLRALIHRFWKYQEPELKRLGEYVDNSRTAVDIGAWWGPWTADLARRCPAVHSFEPQPKLASQLRSWAPANVVVHEAALSDSQGVEFLKRPNDLPGTDGLATLRSTDSQDTTHQVQVEVTTLDLCELQNIGFIKIDVEGLELATLAGAEQTITRDHPRLMIEIEQRHMTEPMSNVFDWLEDRGYQGWYLRDEAWAHLETFEVERDQTRMAHKPKSADYINAFLFIHASDGWVR